MRPVGLALIVSALLFGCANQAPQQPAQETAATPPQPGEKKDFVSVPELNDLMEAIVQEDADLLWKITGKEDSPKPTDDDGWKRLEHAAVGIIEAGRFIQVSPLAKDQGDWQKKTQVMIDVATTMRKQIQARDGDALFMSGGDLEESCSGCHKQYYLE